MPGTIVCAPPLALYITVPPHVLPIGRGEEDIVVGTEVIIVPPAEIAVTESVNTLVARSNVPPAKVFNLDFTFIAPVAVQVPDVAERVSILYVPPTIVWFAAAYIKVPGQFCPALIGVALVFDVFMVPRFVIAPPIDKEFAPKSKIPVLFDRLPVTTKLLAAALGTVVLVLLTERFVYVPATIVWELAPYVTVPAQTFPTGMGAALVAVGTLVFIVPELLIDVNAPDNKYDVANNPVLFEKAPFTTIAPDALSVPLVLLNVRPL